MGNYFSFSSQATVSFHLSKERSFDQLPIFIKDSIKKAPDLKKAVQCAKSSVSCLFLLIDAPLSFASRRFVQNFIFSDEFIGMMDEIREVDPSIVWYNSSYHSREAQLLLNLTAEMDTFIPPGLLVIDPNQGKNIYRIVTSLSYSSLESGSVNILKIKCLSYLTDTIIPLRFDRDSLRTSREIRTQQDSAYEISLKKDREKALKQKLLQEELDLKLKKTKKKQELLNQRRLKAKQLISRDRNETKQLRVSFKLPGGHKLNHTFLISKEYSTTKEFYDFIYKQEDFDLSNFIVISTVFPRRELSDSDDLKIVDIPEIYPSGATLLVEEMFEDENIGKQTNINK